MKKSQYHFQVGYKIQFHAKLGKTQDSLDIPWTAAYTEALFWGVLGGL